MRYRTLHLALLVSAFLFTACAYTTMRSIHRVLVIGHFSNQAIRKSFEEEFVRQWRRHGVQAVSSLDVLPPSTPLTKDEVAPIAKTQGFDTVLVTRLLERKTIHPGEPAVPTIEPPSPSDLPDSDTAWHVLLAPPVSISEFDLVTVETTLYDVASERRVWVGWSETEVMNKIPKLIPPFVKLILKHLYAGSSLSKTPDPSTVR
jgi:hypothetical protein